jgi:8-oxo-dGTP diphosphatase
LLLLNRLKPPGMGRWNGVGGKVQPGEEPAVAALRELEEETGISGIPLRFAGLVTWEEDGARGALWTYLGEVPAEWGEQPPRAVAEGILAWHPIDWVLDPRNLGAMPNLRYFLPPMLAGEAPAIHHCTLTAGRMLTFATRPWAG